MVEQVIRPTGLMDPVVDVRPVKGQVDDLLAEIRIRAANDQRVLVTTLTKRMAEDLTEYYHDLGVRVRYLHSDVETLERVRILRDLRKGEFDVLVGINLLREGLDLPEVSLVAILDADKEGFLRSGGSLHPDHGPRRPQRGGDGHPLRGQGDGLHEGAPSARPTAAARSRPRTTRSTASRRRASRRTSASCCRRCTRRTT